MRKSFLLIPLVLALRPVLAAPAIDGKWSVQTGRATRPSIEVVVDDGKGTWTFYASTVAFKDNFCTNKHLPLVVKSATDTEVMLQVDGNSVLNGCFTASLLLHAAADGTWTGTLPGGTVMTWTRK